MSQKQKQPAARQRGRTKHKRGVILLIVVSLLTLMVLIGAAIKLALGH